MIKIEVLLTNEFDRKWEVVELSEEELKQMACNKARGKYGDYYNSIVADGLLEITMSK